MGNIKKLAPKKKWEDGEGLLIDALKKGRYVGT
jgi:hypothetical protein